MKNMIVLQVGKNTRVQVPFMNVSYVVLEMDEELGRELVKIIMDNGSQFSLNLTETNEFLVDYNAWLQAH